MACFVCPIIGTPYAEPCAQKIGVIEIKTVPYIPLSNPLVERLIGTIRREFLDHVLFWTAADLESKLSDFRNYYNKLRVHSSLDGEAPIEWPESKGVDLKSYRWKKHCRVLYEKPIAA